MKPNRLLFFFRAILPKEFFWRGGFRLFLAAGIAIIAVASVAANSWYSQQLGAVGPGDAKTVIIKVVPGANTGEIADLLITKNLIKNRTAFLFAAKMDGLDKSLQAGEYALSRSQGVQQMIAIMAKGVTAYSQFTVPEGFTVEQIGTLLEEKGLARKERFLAIAKDYAPFDKADSRPGVKYRAEGFLFPETYRINLGATEEDIIKMMSDEFGRQFSLELQEKSRATGMSAYDVIVLASLIEREVQLPRERPMVARVFLNRLKIDMPLQSCATIQYILGYAKEDLSIADTQIPSPYNSYLNPGMPPGPVANPGLPSIQAALNPAVGDWLYFVVDGKTGGHRFSRTLAEHDAAIGLIGK